MAGISCGQSVDTLRIHLKQPNANRTHLSAASTGRAAANRRAGTSAMGLSRSISTSEVLTGLYCRMATPRASVAFQPFRLSAEQLLQPCMHQHTLRSMYRGLWVNVLSDAPALGVYFWCYTRPKRWLSPGHRNGEEGTRAILLAGGLDGVGSWVFCYPSAMKRRLQAQSVPLPGKRPLKYLGVVDCLHKCVREEGTRLLFLGQGTDVAGL